MFWEIAIHASLLFILAIVFAATLVRSAFGFGEALIAVPLLALFMPVQVAAPLAVLLSISVAAVVVVQDWRHIHLRSAAGLLLATVFGIPLGLLVLTCAHQQWVKAGLGIFIMLFAAYSLLSPGTFRLDRDNRPLLLLSGFLAGILGGAYGMNGPPLVIYGSLRRWSPQHFRATLHAYFLPASILGMIGYWSAGLWTRTVTHEFLFSVPAMLPAVFLGRAINRRFSGTGFLNYVYGGLMLIGAMLLWETLTHRA
ncbi:sulfite exporter TauE/SafE family protein [Silvibacterium acidisoli]|uniref:sulfite exporter TauE/SafE family protein n=1 Tax=Acidobacteriaceae bacterium ZG23-2 TaxID=2883246 RepID=UPI00406D4336